MCGDIEEHKSFRSPKLKFAAQRALRQSSGFNRTLAWMRLSIEEDLDEYLDEYLNEYSCT
jgi:hypothetical protein